MKRRALAIAVVCAIAAAGCIGGGDDGDGGGDRLDQATSSDDAVAAGPVPLTLADLPAARSVLWANGTFEVTQHYFPGRFVPGLLGVEALPSEAVFVDVTDAVPMGLPVRVMAQVDAAVGRGDVDLWLEVGENQWWTGDWDTPTGGYSRFEAVIVRGADDPIQVGLLYDEIDGSQAFEYVLKIQVETDPAVLPVGLPYGLTLGPGAVLSATYVPREFPGFERAETAVLLWDPDDRFLGRFPVQQDQAVITLPDDAPQGEYVVFFAQGRGGFVVEVEGVAARPDVRLLRADWQFGDLKEAPPGGGTVEWSFEVPRVPILVGFFSDAGPAVGTEVAGAMRSPVGPLFDFRFVDELPVMLFPGVGADSGYGAETLVPGTYDASASFGTSAGDEPVTFVEFVVYWVR